VLWFSVAYEKIAVRSSSARAVVFLVEFFLLYYIAGGASFVFALLATIYELFSGRRKILALLFPTVAIGTYFVARYIFDLKTEIIHLQSLATQPGYGPWVRNIVICIYIFFPLVLFIAGLWQWSATKKAAAIKPVTHKADKSKMRAKHKPSAARRFWQLLKNKKYKWAIETALPTVILAVSIFVSFDSTKKKLVQVDYFARQRMWPEVLHTARQIRPQYYNTLCIHSVDRALYHCGQLGDEMFRYPQSLSSLLLIGIKTEVPSDTMFIKVSQFFLELGHIAEAERLAFEYLEIVGSNPIVLEQLATIKLVKGQVEAAKVFLKALSKDLIFGNRGREMLRRIEEDPGLANDERIQYTRSITPDKESASSAPDGLFYQLLEKNRNNKMAFEYMMAFYLLTGQIEKVVANISHLNDLGYERLPQYYEEAIVIYTAGRQKTDLAVSGWTPQGKAIQRAKIVGETNRLYYGNEQRVRQALGPDFANSYFLYYIFDVPKLFGAPGARR
jgi:hypothetical protein